MHPKVGLILLGDMRKLMGHDWGRIIIQTNAFESYSCVDYENQRIRVFNCRYQEERCLTLRIGSFMVKSTGKTCSRS